MTNDTSRLRIEIDSKPTKLDKIDRAIMQLKRAIQRYIQNPLAMAIP